MQETVIRIIKRMGVATVGNVLKEVRIAGKEDATKTDVNKVLYALQKKGVIKSNESTPPIWSLVGDAKSTSPVAKKVGVAKTHIFTQFANSENRDWNAVLSLLGSNCQLHIVEDAMKKNSVLEDFPDTEEDIDYQFVGDDQIVIVTSILITKILCEEPGSKIIVFEEMKELRPLIKGLLKTTIVVAKSVDDLKK